ncbi:MAG: AmmeMemoRadiSam system protein B [Rubripirellula sp.]
MNNNPLIPSLKLAELELVHQTACKTVKAAVHYEMIDACQELEQLADLKVSGVFVTLKRGNTLRGCCGMLGASLALSEALADSAKQTALHDPRMAPITAIELPHLTLSVSVLGTPRVLNVAGEDRVNAIQIGRHGLRIRYENHAGLLLPAVAKERDWNARQFLDAVCTKAGLPSETWKSEDAMVEIFDGIDHSAAFVCGVTAEETPTVSPETLKKLSGWIESNLAAMQQGATPAYYATDVDDITVAGVVLIVAGNSTEDLGLLQINIQEGLPLQSTLFQLTEAAAKKSLGLTEIAENSIALAVLSQLIHHGTDREFDASEVAPEKRAILAMDNRCWSLEFNTEQTVDEIINRALAAEPFRRGSTMVYSAKCDSTQNRVSLSSRPPAVPHAPERSPTVAGSFYPEIDSERDTLIDEILSDLAKNEVTPICPQRVNAAMVPHAGLRYSGRIAAEIWRRIHLPNDILIIGPKHTADGAPWAVAPHETWKLSDSTSLRGNPAFAKMLADNVPGMELDANAHRREHGIEVQLPFLQRLAPSAQITAIAMGRAEYTDLQEAARALATLLKPLPTQPLIVISSDMNHFAEDRENQRRDQLALEQLAALDPSGLLKTCKEENISMCGQIPAAFVLLTLQYMQRTCNYQKIAYATSAEVTGDISSVVGYAGVVF